MKKYNGEMHDGQGPPARFETIWKDENGSSTPEGRWWLGYGTKNKQRCFGVKQGTATFFPGSQPKQESGSHEAALPAGEGIAPT